MVRTRIVASSVLFASLLVRRPLGSEHLPPDASAVEAPWTEAPDEIFARIPARTAANELRCATDGGPPPRYGRSKELAAAGDALVAMGLPDPRGCEWREVTFVDDMPAAHVLAAENHLIGVPSPTEAWILPGGELGFSTDGVVRRIARVGAAGHFEKFAVGGGAHGDPLGFLVGEAILVAIYAHRVGSTSLATRLVRERETYERDLALQLGGEPTSMHMTSRNLERIGRAAWLFFEHHAVIEAFRDGAHERTVATALRALEHLASTLERDESNPRRSLHLRQLAGDAFRRLQERARPSLAQVVTAPASNRRRALIALLDTVQGSTSHPCHPHVDDPVLSAIVSEGEAIRPALADAIARDRRLARGGDPGLCVLTVATVAKSAMERLDVADAQARSAREKFSP